MFQERSQEEVDFRSLLEAIFDEISSFFACPKIVKMRFSCGSDAIFAYFAYMKISCANLLEFRAPGAPKIEVFR